MRVSAGDGSAGKSVCHGTLKTWVPIHVQVEEKNLVYNVVFAFLTYNLAYCVQIILKLPSNIK